MANFLISYDLKNARDYQSMWNMLESWRAVRLLESMWVVTLNHTATELRNHLNKIIDKDDAIAVIEIPKGSWWAVNRTQPEGTRWLQQNVRQ